MRWTATRWMTRGLFECERCGDFPDYRGKPRTKISLNR